MSKPLEHQNHCKESLAELYGRSKKTINAWLAAIQDDPEIQFGKYSGKSFTPRQLQIIKEFWGEPPQL